MTKPDHRVPFHAGPRRPIRLLSLAVACWCIAAPAAAWAGPAVPENGSPLRLVCVENGQCGATIASDVIYYSAHGLGGLTAALFLFTYGASFRLAPEAALGHLAAWGLDALTVITVKRTVGRARPYTYSPRYPSAYSEHDLAEASHSFYSGHASQTAAALFSAATTLTLYHRRGLRWKILCPTAYAVALGATIAVGELRVRAGEHFYSDVITGGMVGALLGIGIPVASYYVAKTIREKRRKVGFTIQPTTAGVQVLGWF